MWEFILFVMLGSKVSLSGVQGGVPKQVAQTPVVALNEWDTDWGDKYLPAPEETPVELIEGSEDWNSEWGDEYLPDVSETPVETDENCPLGIVVWSWDGELDVESDPIECMYK